MKRFLQIFSVAVILIIGFPASVARAQQASQWTEPIDLSNSATDSVSPSLAVDSAGGVHVVWLESLPKTGRIILLTNLNNGNWSSPTDIVPDVANNGQGGPRLVSDEQGMLHLVYPGIDGISYSKAFTSQASSPRAWSEPVVLVPANTYLSDFDLAVGSGAAVGTVCVTYAQQIGSGSGVYLICSHDGGQNWDPPYIVYENQNSDQMVDKPRIAIGPDGSLHVVWVLSNYPQTFPKLGIRYSKSTDGGLTWSSAFEMAERGSDDPAISMCAAPQVHVVWSGTFGDRYKFHRWSSDNGRTWSETWRNTDLGGIQGRPDLACDSSGRIHWLVVGTIFGGGVPKSAPIADSLYHTVLSQGKWSPGEILLFASFGNETMQDAQAAVALGNQLYVVVANPLPSAKSSYQYDIFFTSEKLDGPAVPPKALQNTIPTETPMPFAVKMLIPTSSPTTLSGRLVMPDTTPWRSVIIGTLAALMIIIFVLVVRVLRPK